MGGGKWEIRPRIRNTNYGSSLFTVAAGSCKSIRYKQTARHFCSGSVDDNSTRRRAGWWWCAAVSSLMQLINFLWQTTFGSNFICSLGFIVLIDHLPKQYGHSSKQNKSSVLIKLPPSWTLVSVNILDNKGIRRWIVYLSVPSLSCRSWRDVHQILKW